MEKWKPVVGWEGIYEVSDLGRVRSLPRLTKAGWAGSKRHGGKILASFARQDRQFVNLWGEGRRSTCTVHRLVLEAFVGPRPHGMECRHLDGNKQNNQRDNLVWGTHLENEADKVRHGTARRLPLTDDQVAEIRYSPMKQQELAERYGVIQSLVSRIRSGERRP